VHGDIHPANLISPDSDRAPFLVDFSLLKARTEVERPSLETSSQSLSERGRPYFTAPERVRFGRITPSTDLYALGVSALLLHTGQEPSQLYDETLARWTLDSLDPEVQHWLAPLLEDHPARRVQRASDALQLLDQPAAFSPAGPAAASASAASPLDAQAPPPPAPFPPLGVDPVPLISKAAFHDQLVETYGPMVALLLEAVPTLVPPESLLALRQKLVQAGLDVADVDAAIRVAADAVPTAPAAGEPGPEIPAAIAPSTAAEPSELPPVDGLAVLRNRLGLMGAKLGCGLEQCGACAVIADGEKVLSCVRAVSEFEGSEIVTVEGLAGDGELNPVQRAFLDENAAQCGYCTSGLIVALTAFLENAPKPDRQGALAALDGHLCRCGAHPDVLRAIDRLIAERADGA